MINVLENPKTDLYLQVKSKLLSTDFPWFWNYNSINKEDYEKGGAILDSGYNNPYYSHTFLERPEITSSRVCFPVSEASERVSECIAEILDHNKIQVNVFLRICANSVHPTKKVVDTVSHVDHNFEHNNVIIYLTDAGGATIVENQTHDPKEDDVITFGGKFHHFQTPKKERRVVLVATFI